MRRPPSPTEIPAYPITGGIGLLAIAVTLITRFGERLADRLEVAPIAFSREPWRLVTSALPHLSPLHLVFNVYWLWVFGTLLEEALGHARLFGLIVLYAAGSAAAEYAFTQGGLGLSGVGYGLFGMLWILARRDRRFADGVDARTSQLMWFWFLLCIVLTWRGVMNVANVAHGAGALLGVLVGLSMAAKTPARRVAAAIGVCAVIAASFAGATVLRARVNMVHDASRSIQAGYLAAQEGRFDEAIREYQKALEIDPQSSTAWYNLGYSYDASGRTELAIDPFRRAYEIDRADTRHRSALTSTLVRAAVKARERGDHRRAAEYLEGALEVDQANPYVWLDLAFEYDAIGKAVEAKAAREKARSFSHPEP